MERKTNPASRLPAYDYEMEKDTDALWFPHHGDVIPAINGAPVTSYESFVGVLRHHRPDPGAVVNVPVFGYSKP